MDHGCQLRFTSLFHGLTHCFFDEELWVTVCNLGLQLLNAGLVWCLWNRSGIDGTCILLTIQNARIHHCNPHALQTRYVFS